MPEAPIPPPPYLSGYAKEEWIKVAKQLFYLKLLTRVDVSVLAAYCMAYQRWKQAEEALQELGAQLPLKGLMMRVGGGALVRNPLVAIAQHAAADMVRYGAEFGLSPAARAHIALPPRDGKAEKFRGLLAGEGDF